MNSARLDLRSGFALLFLLGAFWLAGPGSRPSVPEVNLEEARALIEAGAVVLDVRERSASENGHLPGAMLIPFGVLTTNLAALDGARTKTIVVYCGDGSTLGPRAAELLGEAGFTSVVNLEPGFEGWRAAGLPVSRS